MDIDRYASCSWNAIKKLMKFGCVFVDSDMSFSGSNLTLESTTLELICMQSTKNLILEDRLDRPDPDPRSRALTSTSTCSSLSVDSATKLKSRGTHAQRNTVH